MNINTTKIVRAFFDSNDYAYYGLKCVNDYGDTVVCKHKEYGKCRQCSLLVIGLWVMMMPYKKIHNISYSFRNSDYFLDIKKIGF